MPEVNVPINGRAYMVACDDGEEEHLRALGEFFDKRARDGLIHFQLFGGNRLLLVCQRALFIL